jgi:hypothetical protein
VAGPEGVLQTGVSPGAALGERVVVGLERGAADGWASSLSVALGRVRGSGQSAESGARATFEVDSGRLRGGIVRLKWGIFALEPSLFVELGRLRADGQHPAGPVTQERVWATTGLTLRSSLTLAERVVLGLGLGAHVAPVSYRFAFTGEKNPLYQNGIIGFDGEVALGARFP